MATPSEPQPAARTDTGPGPATPPGSAPPSRQPPAGRQPPRPAGLSHPTRTSPSHSTHAGLSHPAQRLAIPASLSHPAQAGLSHPIYAGRGSPIYPLSLRLEGRRVLVVGGGSVALRRVAGLREAGARGRGGGPAAHPGTWPTSRTAG